MDSWHKQSRWLFGTLKDHIQKRLEIDMLRISQMQVKGSIEMQMASNGGTFQPTTQGWLGETAAGQLGLH